MSQNFRWLFVLVAMVLVGCANEDGITLKRSPDPRETKPRNISFLDEEREKQDRLREISLQAVPRDFAVQHYNLDIEILPKTAQVKGTVRMDLTRKNASAKVLNVDMAEALVLDKVSLDSLEITKRVSHKKDVLQVPVEGIPDQFSLDVSYTLTDPEKALFFYKEKSTIVEAATLTEPLDSRFWFPCIDHPAVKADTLDVKVTVPENWKALSNGSLVGVSYKNKKATFHWNHNFPISTYLISIAAGVLEEVKAAKNSVAPIAYWITKDGVGAAEKGFHLTPDMMDFYSEKLVKYPFEKYFVGVIRGFPSAMEHTTATTFAYEYQNAEEGLDPSTAAHELAHHWFGDTVTCATWTDLWLNESFASLFDVLFWENHSGIDKRMERILGYRVRYLETEAKGGNGSLGPIYNLSTDPDSQFNVLSYEKGALVFDYFRYLVGDDKFYGALASYLQAFKFQNATTLDFKKHLESYLSQDFTTFFSQWIYGAGYPELKYKWRWNESKKSVDLTVEQVQTAKDVALFDLKADVKISIKDKQGKVQERVEKVNLSSQRKVVLSIPSNVKPRSVVFDPERRILSTLKADKASTELDYIMENDPNFLARIEAVTTQGSNIDSKAIANLLNRENHDRVKAVLLDQLEHSPESEADTVARSYLANKNPYVRGAAVEVYGKLKSRLASREIIEIFLNDAVHWVAMSAAETLGLSKDTNAVEALLTEFDRPTSRRYVLSAVVKALGDIGDRRATGPVLTYLEKADSIRSRYKSYVKMSALGALKKLKDPASVERLGEILQVEKDPLIQKIILDCFLAIDDQTAIAAIDVFLARQDLDPGTRAVALDVKEQLLK